MNYISKNTKIANDVILEEPIRTYGSVTIKPKSRLGAYLLVNNNTTIFRDTIIGKYCSIGKNCEIGAFDHPIDWLSTSPFQYNVSMHFPDYTDSFNQIKILRPKQTVIGNDVWIGPLCIIKRGVVIGDGAIVAGGAVVISDIPPYAIVGGVPAKIIKYRFSDDIITQLLKIKWWDYSSKRLKDLPFNDIKAVIKKLSVDELKGSMKKLEEKKISDTSQSEFYRNFSFRLLEDGVSKELVTLILENLKNPYFNYNWDDIYDVEIFENKISVIISLLDLPSLQVEDIDFNRMNTVFRTKH